MLLRSSRDAFPIPVYSLWCKAWHRLVAHVSHVSHEYPSLAGQTLYPIATLGKGVWSNSHSGLVSTGPGISWTGNWFRVAVTSLYKQCGWIKIAREVFATRQLFSQSYHEGSAQKTVKPHLPYNQNKLPATDTIVLTVQDQLAMGVHR